MERTLIGHKINKVIIFITGLFYLAACKCTERQCLLSLSDAHTKHLLIKVLPLTCRFLESFPSGKNRESKAPFNDINFINKLELRLR